MFDKDPELRGLQRWAMKQDVFGILVGEMNKDELLGVLGYVLSEVRAINAAVAEKMR